MILTESFLRREDVSSHFRMDGGEVLHEIRLWPDNGVIDMIYLFHIAI